MKTKYYHLKELYDFSKIKEIRELLADGYTVFIIDRPPMNWGHYSLYSKEDLLWFIEWVIPKFLNRIKELE
jgi:hypothetical protein